VFLGEEARAVEHRRTAGRDYLMHERLTYTPVNNCTRQKGDVHGVSPAKCRRPEIHGRA
jgi:hypothetical protein